MKKSSGYVSNKFINLMFFELNFDMEFDHYETYCSRMESALGEEEHRLQHRLEDESADLSGYEKAKYLEDFGSSYENDFVTNIFPDIQRKSGLISLYALLEKNLSEICKKYEEKGYKSLNNFRSNNRKKPDYQGLSFPKWVEKYLIQVGQIDFPNKSVAWKEIEMIKLLRNSCVHSNGSIPIPTQSLDDKISKEELLIEYIDKSDYLDKYRQGELFQEKAQDSKEPYQLLIKKGYLEYCITVVKTFFEDLFQKLKEKNTTKLELM